SRAARRSWGRGDGYGGGLPYLQHPIARWPPRRRRPHHREIKPLSPSRPRGEDTGNQDSIIQPFDAHTPEQLHTYSSSFFFLFFGDIPFAPVSSPRCLCLETC